MREKERWKADEMQQTPQVMLGKVHRYGVP